jgi:cysteine-rich repeat protein
MTWSRAVLPIAVLTLAGCAVGDETGSTSFGFTITLGDGDGDDTGSGDGDGDGDPGDGDGDGDGDTGGDCGNSMVEPGEQCDQGADNSATGNCTPECQIASCGDGYVYEGFEACDDGNDVNTDACVLNCATASCGDGFLQDGVEVCDDGNDDNTDECNDLCLMTSCGDGVVQAGEQCDDANADDTDECPTTCQLAFCGDGFIQADTFEICDDGNLLDNDGCVGLCVPAVCGDGLLWEGMEDCEDGNMIDDACTSACTDAYCGDGFHWQGMEDCDDGNMVDDDACANDCTLDVQYTCKTLKQSAPNTPDGMYLLDPDGLGGSNPFMAYCDMTTDGGGWTLILNRLVDSDQNGQPDLDATLGVPDALRATNWQFNIDLFWAGATDFVFADKENANCQDCNINEYDSAIRVPKPAGNVWSKTCNGNSTQINITKLAGPALGNGVAFQCADTLGWGACGGGVCHYGTHSNNTSSDGSWSQNGTTEMHFPSAYSSYKQYGNFNAPPSAWCRSCGGGLAATLNMSTTCCSSQSYNARSRWTLWVR